MKLDKAKASQQIRELAWSEYWSTGALHSCVTSLDDSYSGAIGDFWRETASAIPENIAILDIATGNGPIPKFLAGHIRASSWQIRGIDIAAIRPGWLGSIGDIDVKLVGNCELGEAQSQLLENEDPAEYVVVTSQFGWEYITPRTTTILETLRLTQPGGSWRFVCHHAESVLSQVAREEVAHADLLLSDNGLLQSAANLLPWLLRAQRDPEFVRTSQQAGEARNAYNDALDQVELRIKVARAPDLLSEMRSAVHELTMRVASNERFDHAAILARWRQVLRAARFRSQELVDHALSSEDIDVLFAELRTLDADVLASAIELRQAEGLLGWGIRVDWSV